MLVKWGLDQAKKDNVPAFLEAGQNAAPLYEKCGFQRVGETALNLEEYGFEDPKILSRMAANLNAS